MKAHTNTIDSVEYGKMKFDIINKDRMIESLKEK